MLLCKSKNVGHIFNVLLSITSKLGKVFAIICIFIFTFASIGLHIYMEDYHNIPEVCRNATTSWNCSSVYSGAFDHVAIASLHMFVLMSTENYPDVIIPAYDVNQANFFYFMLYLYVGVFFLMAILLAIIVESYWEYSKKHVKLERLREREELVKAWNLIDLNGTGYLSVDDPKLLSLFKILRPKNQDDENLELITYISMYNEDFIIDSYDWTTRLLETFNIEFEPEEDPTEEGSDHQSDEEKQSAVGASIRRVTARIIHAHWMGISTLVLILVHSILFSLMWNGITDETQLALHICRSVIVFLFLVEVMMRIVVDGSKLLNFLDVLDILMVVIAIVGNIIWYTLWFQYFEYQITIYLGACIVASSLAVLARLLFNSEQARTAVQILRNIYPVMFDLILLVITIIFFYAVIGLEGFQDATLAKSQASGFVGSYVQYDCGVGFETFGCALLVVFQIVTTNDWHQIMLGAMIDSGWQSAFYFMSCYLIVDMIVMNLFVAISIEAYKKLARDKRDMDSQLGPTDTPDHTETQPEERNRNDQSMKEAAKLALTGLFASTRTSKASTTSVNNNTITSLNGGQYMGRRGTRGSVATISLPRTPVLDRDSSEEDLSITSRRSNPGTPRRRKSVHNTAEVIPRKRMSIVNAPDTSLLRRKNNTIKDVSGRISPGRDRRQGVMKARSDRKRRERKEQKKRQSPPPEEKQDEKNRLQVPEPKLSITDIVNLKKSVKVMRSYKAKTVVEMSIEQGQVLSVTEDSGDMYKGPDGWFPKTHTSDLEATRRKAFTQPEQSTFSSTDSPDTRRRKLNGGARAVNFSIENENGDKAPLKHPGLTAIQNPGIQHRNSIGRMRRKTDVNDWRREILGDITVMNRDEMKELNKQLRGGFRNGDFEKRHTRMGRSSSFNPQQRQFGIVEEEIIEEKEEPPEVPQVTVSEAPQASTFTTDESGDDTVTKNTNTLTLTVPGSRPRKQHKPVTGASSISGDGPKGSDEIPEWAKNFAAEKGIAVEKNLNFDEARIQSAGSSDEEDRLSKYSGILVHRSDTSTASSQENLNDTSAPALKVKFKTEDSTAGTDTVGPKSKGLKKEFQSSSPGTRKEKP